MLLAVIALSVVVVVGEIIAMNATGEVSEGVWWLVVPVGLAVVPLIDIICLVMLLRERRRA